MIRTVTVVGGGTAGLLSALTLRQQLPSVAIRVVHSRDIGIIGVGEGTTPLFPRHLLETLQLDPRRLYGEASPTWKLGIRFFWGSRPIFYYSFTQQFQARWSDLPQSHGFYLADTYVPADLSSALMAAGKCAPRRLEGTPDFLDGTALHVENARLVAWLDSECRAAGIEFIEGTVQSVDQTSNGDIAALILTDAQRVEADFFVDASGFRSELVGRALGESFTDWSHILFCNRAVIGGWTRTDEPILPYTTAETMDAGWCWQIEHERFINRGYVYSSSFISDEDARVELLRKNPRIPPDHTRVVKFRSGYIQNSWVRNCVAVGNSAGFVEPLEATALSVLVLSAGAIAEVLTDSALNPTAAHAIAYNRYTATVWEETRDFLALHYRFNTRLDTPFWLHAREETPLGTIAALVEFYQDAGPAQFGRYLLQNADNVYALEGHLAMLVGQGVPYRAQYTPTAIELATWQRHTADFAAKARIGLTVEESLAAIRAPGWRW
jgi:tryptophan 7-halogenase